MILPDVNILVHAFREDTPRHELYRDWLEGRRRDHDLLLPDAVLAGFLRVVTLPHIWSIDTPMDAALTFVRLLRADRSHRVVGVDAIWRSLIDLAQQDGQVRGNKIPDAYLAATAITNGARLASHDRGFARYPGLRWFDPGDEL